LILYSFVSLKTAAAISSGVLALTAYYLVRRSTGSTWRYVRLRRVTPRLAVYTVIATIALIPLAASLMGAVITFFEIPQEWLEATYDLVRADDLPDLVFVWLITAVLVPWGEEFVFRGVLQNSLASRFQPVAAVLIASAAFAVLHIWRFPSAFVLGLLLGVLYVWTRSLLAPLIAHITVNSVVVVGTFLLERVGTENLAPWVVKWGTGDAAAPVAFLGVSLVVFAVFMLLIRRAGRMGSAPGECSGPGAGGDAAP
jgi:membrane protease YdiL (CAAX protease family)